MPTYPSHSYIAVHLLVDLLLPIWLPVRLLRHQPPLPLMFSLGSDAVCDVCLEPFGVDLKAPCSISWWVTLCIYRCFVVRHIFSGHVFCADCLQHITRQSCPLCRVHFDPRLIIKLHVDLDSLKAASPTTDGTVDSVAAERAARSLHERIAAVANAGTTEANLRALISECKTFLSNHPRSLVSFQNLLRLCV